MGNSGFGVRLFEVKSDGVLEPILGVDEDYFGGTVPNVGDTYESGGLHDVYRFYLSSDDISSTVPMTTTVGVSSCEAWILPHSLSRSLRRGPRTLSFGEISMTKSSRRKMEFSWPN